MANRSMAPEAAFACVLDVNGTKFKLLRHHSLDTVRDGSEHDTVDPSMLSFALRMIDQVPVSDEERQKIRVHLRDHQVALADKNEPAAQPNDTQVNDVNRQQLEKDPDMARRLANGDDEGVDGNDSLKNPRTDMKMEPDNSVVVKKDGGTTTAQLAQDNAGGSITGGGSTPTLKGEKDTDAGNPKGDHQDTLDKNVSDDVEKKPSAGLGKPAHSPKPSEGVPDTDRPTIHDDSGEKQVGNPGDVERGAGVPSSSKKAKEGLHNPEDDIRGKSKKKAKSRGDDDPKVKPAQKKSKVNAEVGDWVRNKEGRVGVVVSVNESGKATIKVPSTGKEVTNKGWQVIVKANEVNKNDPADVLQKELRILNSPEALMKFATPTPEGQAARKNKIALCSVQDLTQVGRKFVQERLYSAIAGKVNSKVQSVDKLGSRELVVVRMGDDDEFPISTMLEIRKDKDGKVDAISMFDSFLPVEVFRDFAKFLNGLAKQAPSKSDSGAKLERCVSDVLSKKVSDFKKNSKSPSTDQRKKMRSSAFAICTAQGLK